MKNKKNSVKWAQNNINWLHINCLYILKQERMECNKRNNILTITAERWTTKKRKSRPRWRKLWNTVETHEKIFQQMEIIPCSCRGRQKTIKMSIDPKLFYSFNVIPIKIPVNGWFKNICRKRRCFPSMSLWCPCLFYSFIHPS